MANIEPLKPQESLDETRERVNRQFNELNKDVKATNQRVNTIIAGNSETKDPELTDIHYPDPSYTPARPIDTAGDIVRDMQKQFSEQLADKAQKTDLEALEQYTEQHISDIESNKASKDEVLTLEVTKANVSYVRDLVAGLTDGTPESFPNLAAIIAAYPNGSPFVKLNREDRYVYEWNGTSWGQAWEYQGNPIGKDSLTYDLIAPKGVSRGRTKFFSKTGANLFDKDDEVSALGYYNTSGVWSTTPAGYGSTGFIEVEPSAPYNNNFGGAITFWDINKNFISGSNWSSTITTPANARYVNFAFLYADIGTKYLYKGNAVLPYETARYKDEKLRISASQLDILKPISTTANLFDTSKVYRGGYFRSDGTFVISTSYFSSGLIPVTPGMQYIHKWQNHVTFWDKDKKYLSGVEGPASNPFTVPAGAAYAIFTVALADIETDMLVKGSSFPSTYIPFSLGYELDESVRVKDDTNNQSELTGLVLNALGDSLTAALGASMPYHAIIANKHGMTVNNYGISGSRIAVWPGHDQPMVTRYQDMADNADIITVFGGTNDEANSVTLGDINSTDTGTFYGALNVLCLGLIQKYPGKRIGFITPMMKRNVNYTKMQSYVNAMKEVCAKYSIPVLDLFAGCGLYPTDDSINNTFFYNADGLHPNNAGHEVIARRIEQFIKSL